MAQFGGMPYFEGVVTSNSALLSQPTSLASNMGRAGKSDTPSSRSNGIDKDKVPKGAPGETLAYILENNMIEQEKQNIKMDMIREIEASGGPSPNVVSAVQKKYAPKLSYIASLEFQQQANFHDVELRGARIDATAEALNKEPNMLAADGMGNLLGMHNSELASYIKRIEKVPDELIDLKPVDIDGMESRIKGVFTGAGSILKTIDPKARLEILQAAARGEDIMSDEFMNKLSAATRAGSDNIQNLKAGISSAQRILTPGTEEYRAFNYSFNMHDLSLTTEQKQRKNKQGELEEIPIDERRINYFDNFISDKIAFARNPHPDIDKGFIDRMGAVKEAYDNRRNSRLVNIIQGTGEYGFDRKLPAFAFSSSKQVKDDPYRALFGTGAVYESYANSANKYLEGSDITDNNILSKFKGFSPEKIKELTDITNQYQLNVNGLIEKGFQQEAEGMKKSYQTEFFRLFEPEKYEVFNVLGKVVTDSKDLSILLKEINEKKYEEKIKGQGFWNEPMRFISALTTELAKDIGGGLGLVNDETLKELNRWKTAYDSSQDGATEYIFDNGELVNPKQLMQRIINVKESILSPYEREQLIVQQNNLYEGEYQVQGEFAGVKFNAASLPVLRVNSIIDNFRTREDVLSDFMNNRVTNGAKYLRVEAILDEARLQTILNSKNIENFDQKNVKFISGGLILDKEGYKPEGEPSSMVNIFGSMKKVYEKLGIRLLTTEEINDLRSKGMYLGKGNHYTIKNVFLPYSEVLMKADIDRAKKEPVNIAVGAETGIEYPEQKK